MWREFDSQRTALLERYSQGSLGGGTGAQPVSGITGRPVLFSAQTAPSVEVRGEGDRLLSKVCRANKRDGSPCTAPATGANRFCWAHDPANSEERRRIASKGGRGKGGGELSDLKRQVKDLIADVLDGKVERGQAAVANQLYNTLIRAIEQERKLRELEELAQRLEAMEEALKGRKVG